jgi:hypothetical protein
MSKQYTIKDAGYLIKRVEKISYKDHALSERLSWMPLEEVAELFAKVDEQMLNAEIESLIKELKQ